MSFVISQWRATCLRRGDWEESIDPSCVWIEKGSLPNLVTILSTSSLRNILPFLIVSSLKKMLQGPWVVNIGYQPPNDSDTWNLSRVAKNCCQRSVVCSGMLVIQKHIQNTAFQKHLGSSESCFTDIDYCWTCGCYRQSSPHDVGSPWTLEANHICWKFMSLSSNLWYSGLNLTKW